MYEHVQWTKYIFFKEGFGPYDRQPRKNLHTAISVNKPKLSVTKHDQTLILAHMYDTSGYTANTKMYSIISLYIDKCISWGERIVYGDSVFFSSLLPPHMGSHMPYLESLGSGSLIYIQSSPRQTLVWGQDARSFSFQKLWCSLLWGCWVHVTTTTTKREKKERNWSSHWELQILILDSEQWNTRRILWSSNA